MKVSEQTRHTQKISWPSGLNRTNQTTDCTGWASGSFRKTIPGPPNQSHWPTLLLLLSLLANNCFKKKFKLARRGLTRFLRRFNPFVCLSLHLARSNLSAPTSFSTKQTNFCARRRLGLIMNSIWLSSCLLFSRFLDTACC